MRISPYLMQSVWVTYSWDNHQTTIRSRYILTYAIVQKAVINVADISPGARKFAPGPSSPSQRLEHWLRQCQLTHMIYHFHFRWRTACLQFAIGFPGSLACSGHRRRTPFHGHGSMFLHCLRSICQSGELKTNTAKLYLIAFHAVLIIKNTFHLDRRSRSMFLHCCDSVNQVKTQNIPQYD